MKRAVFVLFVVGVASAFAGWALASRQASRKQRGSDEKTKVSAATGRLAARAAALVASADSAGIRGETAKKEEEIVVRDAKWIRHASEVIGAAPISGSVACMCIGWRTAYFYKNGEFVVSVAAIHGNQLRIHSKKGGGDFPIDEAHWKAVKAALEVTTEAQPEVK